jgi:ABC-2 type transport system permease protein
MPADVLPTELLKLRRSSVPFVSLVAVLLGPSGIALLMWIVRDPVRAAELGLLGTKANLAGLEATWPAFGGFLTVVVGAGGMLLLAFVVAFLFGREYADGTAKNLLTLPVARGWFVAAKLLVAAGWWLLLAIAALAWGFALGGLLGLPGLTPDLALATIVRTLAAAGLAYLLAPVLAWITIWSRSYLAALGFALGALLLGDLLGHTGWAAWFPWSVVLLGGAGMDLPWGGYVVVAATFVAGIAGALLHLRYADNP